VNGHLILKEERRGGARRLKKGMRLGKLQCSRGVSLDDIRKALQLGLIEIDGPQGPDDDTSARELAAAGAGQEGSSEE